MLSKQTIEKAAKKTRTVIAIVITTNLIEMTFVVLIPEIVPNPARRSWVVSAELLVINLLLMVSYLLVLREMIKLLNMFEEAGSSFAK